MAIRVTQQYVDVLGTVAGKLRVARQYIEVLHVAGSSDTLADATDTLVFTSDASGIIEEQSANSVMTLSSDAAVAVTLPVSASSVMALSDSAIKTATGIAVSTINLVDSNTHVNYVADRQVPESVLSFTQLVESSEFKTGTATLAFVQTVEVQGPVQVATASQITFAHASRSLNIYRSAATSLGLISRGAVPIELTVSHTLSLVQMSAMEFVNQVITFVSTATVGKAPGVQPQVIVFTQTLVPHGTFRRTISQALGIGHSLTYYDDTPCGRKQYTPFMGDNTVPNTSAPPAGSMPAPQADTSTSSPCDPQRMLLYWPARGARTTTVSLRAPEFGNRDRNAYTRVSRETRGGTLVVYADPAWPQVRTLLVTIRGLAKSDVDALQSLFLTQLGKLIGLTDWEGHEWEGVITDPEQPATEDGKEGWTVTFTFEGQLIEGYSPGHNLSAAQSTATGIDPGANNALALAQELGGAMPAIDRGQSVTFTQTAGVVVV